MHTVIFVILILRICCIAAEIPESPKSLTNQASVDSYQRLTLQIENIVSRTTNPKEIEMSLTALLANSSIRETNRVNWADVRYSQVVGIFTYLTLLEYGLRETAAVSNITVMMPSGNFLRQGNRTSIDSVSDPDDRKQLLAYRAALRAHSQMWNLHQAFQAEYRRHWNPAIGFVADAYSRPPVDDSDLVQLLARFSAYDCSREISNRLFNAKK